MQTWKDHAQRWALCFPVIFLIVGIVIIADFVPVVGQWLYDPADAISVIFRQLLLGKRTRRQDYY